MIYCVDFIQIREVVVLARRADSVGIMFNGMLKWPKIVVTPGADTAKVAKPRQERDNGCGHCRVLRVSTGVAGPVKTRVVLYYA